jgi:hypothetical protein
MSRPVRGTASRRDGSVSTETMSTERRSRSHGAVADVRDVAPTSANWHPTGALTDLGGQVARTLGGAPDGGALV